MGEGFGADGSAAHALEVVVADGGGGFEGAIDVGVLDHVTLFGGVGPDAGVAVGLEFEVDGEVVALAGLLLFELTDLAFGAEELLDVVAEFVGDDVGLGELAGVSAEAFEVVPEAEVDVDFLVGGAVEGAGGGLGGAAAGVGGSAIEHELGVAVLSARLREDLGPGFLGVGEDKGDELRVAVVVGRGGGGGAGGAGRGGRGGRVSSVAGEVGSDKVATGDQADETEDDDAGQT